MSKSGQSFFSLLGFGAKSGPDAKTFLASGRSKAEQNDHQSAIEDFNRAIEADPRNASAYANRGRSKAALHDCPGAMTDYNKAIELNPVFAKGYYLARGDAKAHLQDHQGAIDDYTKSMELKHCPEAVHPISNDTIYYRRGLSKIELGQKTSGCSDMKKAADAGLAEAAEALKKFCP